MDAYGVAEAALARARESMQRAEAAELRANDAEENGSILRAERLRLQAVRARTAAELHLRAGQNVADEKFESIRLAGIVAQRDVVGRA